MHNLCVKINACEKTYPIRISDKEIAGLKSEILEIVGKNNFLAVISEKVYKLYGKALDFDKKRIFVLKDGEKKKISKLLKKF